MLLIILKRLDILYLLLLRLNLNLKLVILSEMLTNVTISLKDTLLIGIEKYLKINEVLKNQPPTYRIEDINGKIIGGKIHEQEILKSEFDFDSNIKVLESLNIDLRS